MDISKMKLTKYERAIEKAIGDYVPVSDEELEAARKAIERRRKAAILHIRINQQDLDDLKKKAKKHGVPYQTFIAEILHRFAA